MLSADYAYGPKLLLGLAREPRRLDDNFQLLKQAAGSPNAATQAAAKKLRSGQAIEPGD